MSISLLPLVVCVFPNTIANSKRDGYENQERNNDDNQDIFEWRLGKIIWGRIGKEQEENKQAKETNYPNNTA